MNDSVEQCDSLASIETISFGVFSDLHYAPGKVYSDRLCKDSLVKLKRCIEWFNQEGVPFIVNLGDIVDSAENKNSELAYLEDIREELSKFKGDTHFVLGNHDVYMLTKEEFFQNCGAKQHKGYYSFDQGRYHFIILDGNYRQDGIEYMNGNFNWTDTYIHDSQKEWLINDIEKVQGKKVIIFIHENIDHRLLDHALDPHIIINAHEVRSILEKSGKVIAVFQGHYHYGYYQKINGIHYITETAVVIGKGPEDINCDVVSIDGNNSISIKGFNKKTKILPW